MRNRKLVLSVMFLLVGALIHCSQSNQTSNSSEVQPMSDEQNNEQGDEPFAVTKSEEEWREELTEEEYHILREQGTEPRGSGDLLDVKKDGVFVCAGCGHELFDADTKFDSGTGWPSFWDVSSEDAVRERVDDSLWRTRTEVICARCGGHLGHVFEDGPDPTGLRYCINSLALDFKSEAESENGN